MDIDVHTTKDLGHQMGYRVASDWEKHEAMIAME